MTDTTPVPAERAPADPAPADLAALSAKWRETANKYAAEPAESFARGYSAGLRIAAEDLTRSGALIPAAPRATSAFPSRLKGFGEFVIALAKEHKTHPVFAQDRAQEMLTAMFALAAPSVPVERLRDALCKAVGVYDSDSHGEPQIVAFFRSAKDRDKALALWTECAAAIEALAAEAEGGK